VYVRKQRLDQYILYDASFKGLSFLAGSLTIIPGESLMSLPHFRGVVEA